ncbi:MAG: shikimate kinase [Clostridia bacterium]|nr:shikimate kinase [Clostridia bacterium]
MTITLIGMPAAGKSCMGRALAKKLGMKVIDGDRLIEEVTGRALQDIIDEDGLDAFKRLEEEILLSIKEDNVIITPGGSAIYYDNVMTYFKERGIVVYLYVSPKNLIRRLGDFSKRGVVLKPGQTIVDLYNERAPLLQKYADVTVNCDGSRYSYYQKDALEKISKFI